MLRRNKIEGRPAQKEDDEGPKPGGNAAWGLAAVDQESLLVSLAVGIDHHRQNVVDNIVCLEAFYSNSGPIPNGEWNLNDPFLSGRILADDFKDVVSVHELAGVEIEPDRRGKFAQGVKVVVYKNQDFAFFGHGQSSINGLCLMCERSCSPGLMIHFTAKVSDKATMITVPPAIA
jgi:hypothetical protein